jgi:hypothetical protein
MYHAFVKMIRQLSNEFPEHTIVLRPHPSEDHDAWKTELEGLTNVRVIHEGSALHWISAAEVMIHNSCTTGIESFAMGVPTLAYRPLTSRTYDAFLPNAVSTEAATEGELVDLVKRIVSGAAGGADRGAADKHATANRFFGGLTGPSASETIAAELKQLDVRPRPFAMNRLHAAARELAVRAILPGRASLRRALIGPHPQESYYRQKFPSLPLSELLSDLTRFRQVSGRFGNIDVKEIGETIFCITSAH